MDFFFFFFGYSSFSIKRQCIFGLNHLGWLLLVPYGVLDRLFLFCFCNRLVRPLRGPDHLFVLFPTYYNYLCVVLIYFLVYC
jgi:hypothetical protein